MLSDATREYIRSHFESEFERGSRNVYFDQYYTGRDLQKNLIQDLVQDVTSTNAEISSTRELNDGSLIVKIENEPVLFNQTDDETWLVVYSTALRDRDRDDISNLADKRGWLIESWVPSDVVNNIYKELTPGEESVNIHRRWDPYWIYRRYGEIPEELADYFEDNLDEFVEREIEFSLKTPRRLVEDALKMGATDELLERSEISKSRFKVEIPPSEVIQVDGGVLSGQSSDSDQKTAGVTVRETGKVVHNSGDEDATFYLLNELDRRITLRDEFSEIMGTREYVENDDGSLELRSYDPPKVLKVTFTTKEFNPEASIKLLNIFTVGQDDVEIHGTVEYRKDLEFITESYTLFDDGEYQILFTGIEDIGETNEDEEIDEYATIYIRPINGSASGLAYIFQKLRSKFDPRTTHEIVEDFPDLMKVQ